MRVHAFALARNLIQVHSIPHAMTRFFPWALIAAALALALVPDARAVSLSQEEQELARLLAGDRGQQRNKGRMTLDPILTAVAQARAADMAKRRYFSHTDPEGNGPNFLARSAGYELPSFWGKSHGGNFIESISAGHATPGAAWDAWMRSRVHRTHLLALSSFYRDQTNFGVGCYSDPASPFGRYWVIITAPPERSTTVTARGAAKAIRISASVRTPLINFTGGPPSAPRPAATRSPAAPGTLWNWTEPAGAPRPAVRGQGSG
jgi:uncharacterized protein YkwD